MRLTSTRDKTVNSSYANAILNCLPTDGGLYVPDGNANLRRWILYTNELTSFSSIAGALTSAFINNEYSPIICEAIATKAFPFEPELKQLDTKLFVLELFHGPTCAFKDFGARFMARVMSYFNKDENEPLHILVATSGDTGSAVGSAFHNVPGLDVTILYPEGKISPLQEKQLSTFTGNVRALSVKGTFDDCQRLVKTAFTDEELRKKLRLSSANSINISRLLPQSFYYMYASLVVKNRAPHDCKIDNPSII